MRVLRQLGAKGFRPFFLLTGAFAVAVTPLWMPPGCVYFD